MGAFGITPFLATGVQQQYQQVDYSTV